DYPLEELAEYIDWTFFFTAWEMTGRFPEILDDPDRGDEAKKLYDDAKALLDRIISEKALTAHGAAAIFPAASLPEDEITVFAVDGGEKEIGRIHALRQQKKKEKTPYYLSLADFIAPAPDSASPQSPSPADHLGFFAVTAGHGLEEFSRAYREAGDDYHAIMAQVLADRLAEAFAERLHEIVRTDLWGYAPGEDLSKADLFKVRYQGIRPAPGYPPCPDHAEKLLVHQLLNADENLDMDLTESYMMVPAASVSGYYIGHPESFYFSVGKLRRDQVEDFARRWKIEAEEAERRLASVLAYEPKD
ncbi:MAG: methionine synthase, partial [Spirochaetales bacterium]|nr:methionine synthase [Spirochaetales bacterium]MCF7939809.1 methionine synthase [Spirochaetales bacterium]